MVQISLDHVLRCHGVYTISCDVSGCVYVGSTSRDFGQRWAEQVCLLERGKHGNEQLQEAWKRHGISAFTFTPLHCFRWPNQPERSGEVTRTYGETERLERAIIRQLASIGEVYNHPYSYRLNRCLECIEK